ncbi:MAG: preprotein translocase subunit SecE [Halanaerobiales bacterium]
MAKQSFLGKIGKFFRQVKAEMKKVNWPNKDDLLKNTTVVVVTILAMIIFIGIVDLTLSNLITPLIQ